ncbi:hypothetical protein RvY_09228 [Ramazzottius varieornatus]|uniref:Thioredoxin domain-containing protein n=1 Tax=Ramazzottius varieornatus TaxID=947166 RepID=A0A1D1V8Q0_RAMVA|nr:hypothetical protein RvY_09228 [Ramazzottius varieornatus]
MFRYWRELLRSSALILLFSVLFFGNAGVSALGEDVIEDVNKQGLDKLLADHDFVAVLFYAPGSESELALKELENIDDDCDKFEIPFVKANDKKLAKQYGVASFPALVYFRNKQPVIYNGNLHDEEKVLDWLTGIEGLEVADEIEELNQQLLERLINEGDNVAVLYYKEGDKKSEKVLQELENIDDEADALDINFVKVSDPDVIETEDFADDLPKLVFFRNEIPLMYEGDLTDEETVLKWLTSNKIEGDVIEHVGGDMLDDLIEDEEDVVVLFTDSTDKSEKVLKELENIDDDCDKHGIHFVKTDDKKLAKSYGIDEYPTLVYFEDQIPNMYEGDLMTEDAVLAWILNQQKEETIENVNLEILDKILEDEEYVAVFFYTDSAKCKNCDAVLAELEKIDDESNEAGIHFVKTNDKDLAKKYGVKGYPKLVYIRNKEPLTYTGDLLDEDKLLAWLTAEEQMDIPDRIDDVNRKALMKLVNESGYVACFFYRKKNCPDCDVILQELENIDDDSEKIGVDFVKIEDEKFLKELGGKKAPALVYFRDQVPSLYTGDLKDEDTLLKWLVDGKEADDEIEDINRGSLKKMIENQKFVAVYFYGKNSAESDAVLKELETIDDECGQHDIQFVKTSDTDVAVEYGVTTVPALVYFEDGSPSVYEGDLKDEDKVLQWLLHQRHEDTIDSLNRDMLQKMIEKEDYVAVYFYDADDEKSATILKELENIDDDAASFGIDFVKSSDTHFARRFGAKQFPAIVFYRNGQAQVYKGNLMDEEKLLEWLTDLDTMESADSIEDLNAPLFKKVIKEQEHVAALFYNENAKSSFEKVMAELETIDDEAHAADIDFVKIKDEKLAKSYGVHALPAIVYFKQGDPTIYTGDLRKGSSVLAWLLQQKNPDAEDVIEEIKGAELEKLIDTSPSVAVFFYNADSKESQSALNDLENIDDETDSLGVSFVKTSDTKIARDYGVKHFPALIYFEEGQPSIYDGNLKEEEEVLVWLTHQKNEDTIENVNKEILEKKIEDSEYLAVFFYKPNCKECDAILEVLESIDDDLDAYGVDIVRIHDMNLSKRYGIKDVPALLYFRNGNPLMFTGSMKKTDSVLSWLTDDDNREIAGEIELVNGRLFKRVLEENDYVLALFYEEHNKECEKVLHELENIDDECDTLGIDFVKIKDEDVARKYKIFEVPSLVYFRKQHPIVYDGDIEDEEAVLKWLTSDETMHIDGEIEEVTRKMLEKILDDKDYVAVFFYEKGDEKCEEVLSELENIDEEAHDLKISFVKISDTRLAKKYGVKELPALVYFRKKYPAIYRGTLTEEKQVLDWLRKNRYKHPELSFFMYGIGAITAAFILYTIFFMVFLKDKKQEKRE